MATTLGSVALGSYARYELRYDLLGQNIGGNYSSVRLYGVLVVTGSSISWSRGSASVHTSGLQGIGTSYGRGEHVVIQRDFNFGHDGNGNFSSYIGASISTTFLSGDCGGTLNLPRIIRFASITNSPISFTDEDNPWFDFSNPANSSMSCWLEPNPGGTHFAARILSGTSGRFTWDLTDTERKQLRNACKNANSCVCRIGLYSTISGSTSASYHDRTLKIVNANPIFDNFEWETTDEKTAELTGNDKNVILGYSNIRISIPVEDKAQAIKEATMTKYRLNIGESSTDIGYSEEISTGSISKVPSGTINLYAIDSRGNSTLVTKQAENIFTYNPLIKGDISLQRSNNGVGEEVTLKYTGEINEIDFGLRENQITSATYIIRRSDSQEGIIGATDITPTIENGIFSFEGIIKGDLENYGFDIGSSYIISVIIEDELSSITYSANLGSGRPNIAIAKNGVSIMGKYDEQLGGSLQVDGSIVNATDLVAIMTLNSKTNRSGTFNVEVFDNIEILNSNCFENNNDSLKCLKQGYYKFTQIVRMSDGSGGVFSGLSLNDASDDSLGCWGVNNNRFTFGFSQILKLEINDNIKFKHNGTGISNIGISNGTFWVEFIKES